MRAAIIGYLFGVLVGLFIGTSYADDQIEPSAPTVAEDMVNEWRFTRIVSGGAVLNRQPSLTIRLRGYVDADNCARASDGACVAKSIRYVGNNALQTLRWLNTADFSTASMPEQLFGRLHASAEIGAGSYLERSTLCAQDCPPPNSEATPQPCVDTYCSTPAWVLDVSEPQIEEPAEIVRLDEVRIVFGGSGWAQRIDGFAAGVKGADCARASRADSDECKAIAYRIDDPATVAGVLSNDGSSERIRRRILREGQAVGDLPAGTLTGDGL